MAVGRWKSVCINVTDLDKGFDFWSEVLGWNTTRRNWHGWLGYLTDPESDNFMILNNANRAPVKLNAPTHDEANRVHIDIWPNDGMDNAIRDIVALGGSVKKVPSLYPRPGSHGDEAPLIDWGRDARSVRQRVLHRRRTDPRTTGSCHGIRGDRRPRPSGRRRTNPNITMPLCVKSLFWGASGRDGLPVLGRRVGRSLGIGSGK